MKKVLILGITGTFGKHVAQALEGKGWKIKAMVRDVTKLSAEFENVEVVQGDASNYDDVKQAAKGVTMLVYGVNPANYDWENKALPWLDVSARVAEEQGLTIVFPGNIYNYNPDNHSLVHELSQQSPVSGRGEIRQHMEFRLQRAAEHGAKVLILRMGDFIAAKPSQSWLPRLLSEKKKKVILSSPGPKDIKHAWAYVPDAAAMVALLVEKIDKLPAFSVFHFKGYSLSLQDMADIIAEQTGKPVKVKPMPWWFLSLLRPFLTAIQGVFEMRYLWQKELLLDDNKLRRTIGDVPYTEVGQALVNSGLIMPKT